MNKLDELVLVAERDLVFRGVEPFEGLNVSKLDVGQVIKNYAMFHHFKARRDVEEDPSFKQLIPYVMIKRNKEIVTYRRLSGGGESRLHGQRSLGFGGHMNEIEEVSTLGVRSVSFQTKIKRNLWRELEEELDFSFKEDDCQLDFIGLINDDTDETGTGKVHLGLAAVLIVPPNAEISVRETDAHAIEFMTVEKLRQLHDEFENWSKVLISDLKG